MTANDWRPACSPEMLQIRAAMLKAIRHFFDQHGYLEVETPCLSRDVVIDAWLEPFEFMNGKERWFLQTSPEAFMKRLLAAGSGSIYQTTRVFRSGESGDRHNPEFTMIEWYGVETTWQDQMELTELLVRTAVMAAATKLEGNSLVQWPATPFRQSSYADAFASAFRIDVHSASCDVLLDVARDFGVPLPDEIAAAPRSPSNCSASNRDEILNALLAFGVEPMLGHTSDGRPDPEFLCDYPPTQAALAVTSATVPEVARRFELYINGLELCNGYQELTDFQELQRREFRQNTVRSHAELQPLPGASRLLSAMQSGLPECAGVALGFDRLVMIATGASRISDVLPFPSYLA